MDQGNTPVSSSSLKIQSADDILKAKKAIKDQQQKYRIRPPSGRRHKSNSKSQKGSRRLEQFKEYRKVQLERHIRADRFGTLHGLEFPPPSYWPLLQSNPPNIKRSVTILFGYCGASFHGLQKSKDAWTVEAELERALFLSGCIHPCTFGDFARLNLRRCSRTDKGVHALNTVLSCKVQILNDPRTWEPWKQMAQWYLDGPLKETQEQRPPYLEADSQLDQKNHERLGLITQSFDDKTNNFFMQPYPKEFLRKSTKDEDIAALSPLKFVPDEWEQFPSDFDDSPWKSASISFHLQQLAIRISQNLPGCIRVYSVVRSPKTFNPRLWATRRNYYYLLPAWIFTAEYLNPIPETYFLDENLKSAKSPFPPIEKGQNMVEYWKNIYQNTEYPIPGPIRSSDSRKQFSFRQKMQSDFKTSWKKLFTVKTPDFNKNTYNGEIFQLLQRVCKQFEGVLNYHNFSPKTNPNAQSSLRNMKNVFPDPKPIVIGGEPWVKIHIIGQSFMYHQIRRMIALIVSIMRGFADFDTVFKTVFDPKRSILLFTGPAIGLVLDRVVFDKWNSQLHKFGKITDTASSTVKTKNSINHSPNCAIDRENIEFGLKSHIPLFNDLDQNYVHRHISRYSSFVSEFESFVENCLPDHWASQDWEASLVPRLSARKRNQSSATNSIVAVSKSPSTFPKNKTSNDEDEDDFFSTKPVTSYG